MSEAYRSNTEGEEEKYQEALLLYRKKVQYAQSLSWVYIQRRAKRRAGFLASFLALLCYPVSFGCLLFEILLVPEPSLQVLAWHLWPQGFALFLALLPPLVFWLIYGLSLQTKRTKLETIFGVPPRLASTPESTTYLQQQNPLEKLRDECAKLSQGSASWSFSAITFFSTQLPVLFLLMLAALLERFHPQEATHCWIDATVVVLFVSGFTFLGFYPFILALWNSARGIEEGPDLSPTLFEVSLGSGLVSSLVFAAFVSLISAFVMIPTLRDPSLNAGLRLCGIFGAMAPPLAITAVLGLKVTKKNLQKTREAFIGEYEALYQPKK
jgi:hypothetical protein